MKTRHLYPTLSLSLNLFFAGAVHAGESALSITTDPLDAEIYLNGELKVNTTPVVFNLPAGKYRLDIKVAGKQPHTSEILLAEDSLISKKIVLQEATPLPKYRLNFSSKQDPFETTSEFQERTRQLRENLKDLVTRFNFAVEQQDPLYQAGVASLNQEQYDLHSEVFPLRVNWQAWAKEFDLPEENFVVIIPREEAKALWYEGSQPSVYFYLQANAIAQVQKIVLRRLGKEWPLQRFGRLVNGVKCLEVAGYLYATGATVRIGTCHHYSHQQWRWGDHGKLINRGGKCLMVNTTDESPLNVNLQLGDCEDQPNQQWQFDNQGRLVNGKGLCLEVNAQERKPADGTPVRVFSCHNGSLQRWEFYEW